MKRELRIWGLGVVVLRSLCWLPFPLLLLWFNIEGFLDEEITVNYEPILLGIVMAVSLIGLPIAHVVASWFYLAQGWPLKGITDFCKQSPNPDAMMARMEKIWKEGFRTEANFRADDEYLIWSSSISAGVFPLKDVLWVWTNVTSVPTVLKTIIFFVVYTADGNVKHFSVRKDDAKEIEKYLKENFPDIVVGPHVTMRNYLERRRGAKPEERDVAGAMAYIRRIREE